MRGQNAAMFPPDLLPDSECRVDRQVLFPVLDSLLLPRALQRHSDQKEREALAWGLRL